MQAHVSSTNKPYSRVPRIGQSLKTFVSKVDYFFGRIYEWRVNPFASSGTFATALLAILIVTGLILLLFYRLGTPYDSVLSLQSQVWLGRWVRSIHRYATDLGLVFILFHLFRMFSQGKTWGPRVLAWVSGLIMLGMYALSAFTGFILVWDRFGLKMAKSWAKLVDVLPLLPNPLSRAFSGDVLVGNSFFFMNLFLHVAIPLGLGVALWIHTSKLASPKWLPKVKVIIALSLVLFLLSVFVPAKIETAANLLEMNGSMIEDYWFSWWIELQSKVGNGGVLLFFAFLWTLGLSAPFFWRPKKELAPAPSVHDQEKCEGCRQCYMDCPYEAISMVPRTLGTGSEFVAIVNQADCTSCGLCSGSCSQFAIGPPGKTGRDQLFSLKHMLQEQEKIPVVYCKNQAEQLKPELNQVMMPMDCLGNLHPGVITALLGSHKSVILQPCAPDCCEMRLGSLVEWERLYQNREPGLPARVDRERIVWKQKHPRKGLKSWALTTTVTSIALFGVALISNLPRGSIGTDSFLRLSWRFPIQRIQKCRDLSDAELKQRPVHMRVKQECSSRVIQYLLSVQVDGAEKFKKSVISPGMKSDRPFLVDYDLPLSPGNHQVEVAFIPEGEDALNTDLPHLNVRFNSQFELGYAKLVTITPDQKNFIMK